MKTPERPIQPELTTEDFAAANLVKPNTIRVRLCRTGSYFGVIPEKLPNGRLAWPADGPSRLRQGKATPSAAA